VSDIVLAGENRKAFYLEAITRLGPLFLFIFAKRSILVPMNADIWLFISEMFMLLEIRWECSKLTQYKSEKKQSFHFRNVCAILTFYACTSNFHIRSQQPWLLLYGIISG